MTDTTSTPFSITAVRVLAIEAGRITLTGPAAEVLADARLGELGVAAPAAVRLARAGSAAGLSKAELTRLAEASAQ